MKPRLNSNFPVVNESGHMLAHFRDELIKMGRMVTLTGVGSPEGVVEGTVGQFYMSTTGTAGSIVWVKRDSSIAGDATQGWIAV